MGTNEYMAMERLYELATDTEHDWECIVVDTPPTRSALSFLDAPQRMLDFLGGRMFRWLLWPYRRAGKAGLRGVNIGARALAATVGKIAGGDLMRDTAEFLGAFEGMYEGFRQRAGHVLSLMGEEQTGFVVVTAPERASLVEAGHFVDRLAGADMHLAGVVVNRWRTGPAVDAPDAAERLRASDDAADRAAAACLDVATRLAGARGAGRRGRGRLPEEPRRPDHDRPRAPARRPGPGGHRHGGRTPVRGTTVGLPFDSSVPRYPCAGPGEGPRRHGGPSNQIQRPQAPRRRRRWGEGTFAWPLRPVLLIGTIMVTGVAMAATLLAPVLAIGKTAQHITEAVGCKGGVEDITLRLPKVAQRSVVYASDGVTALGKLYTENRKVVRLKNVSPMAVNAVLGVEDYQFYEHGGIDPKAILRAMIANLKAGHVKEGGSTISQQLVKVITNERADTVSRKVCEAEEAMLLEQKYTKDTILELYLNEIYLGHGAYGLEAAAETYFGSHAANLTLAQSAMLAGMISNPTLYDPVLNPDETISRRDVVLAVMLEHGLIDQEQYDKAKAQPLKIDSTPTSPSRPSRRCSCSSSGSSSPRTPTGSSTCWGRRRRPGSARCSRAGCRSTPRSTRCGSRRPCRRSASTCPSRPTLRPPSPPSNRAPAPSGCWPRAATSTGRRRTSCGTPSTWRGRRSSRSRWWRRSGPGSRRGRCTPRTPRPTTWHRTATAGSRTTPRAAATSGT